MPSNVAHETSPFQWPRQFHRCEVTEKVFHENEGHGAPCPSPNVGRRGTWQVNFSFLKAGHDLGRGKANETSPHARASKRMHDTRLEPLALKCPLCEGRPKGDNRKWGSRSPFTTRPKDLKNRPAVRRRMAARRIGKPEVVDGSVHPPAGRGRTAVR